MRRDVVLSEFGLISWQLRGTKSPVPDAPDLPEPRQATGFADLKKQLSRETPHETSHEKTREKTQAKEEVFSPGAFSDTRGQRIAQLSWNDFAADVAACTACDLCKTRTKAVPGVGDVHARWLFVGEGPGAEEDKKGEPFVGQAGRLLDQMLAALGMKRGSDVYIANVLKCRPPNNRAPTPQEADACRPYLERQIALIAPKIIVALGKSAAMLLLNTDASIASLRGRGHRYQETPLVVTYHPAYLLRSPADKAKSWEDLVFAKRTLGNVSAAQQ
ncbi:MAG: uracil-DNA glycosylase [Burkholderiales bacterium]|jgi:DNA polymerase|nr:uracil-DNA glycosylase [Burkholderiales bacterium]